MASEYVHLIVPRLSVESVRRGIINPSELEDDELTILMADCNAMDDVIDALIFDEVERRLHQKACWAKLNRDNVVVPIYPNDPKHYL